MAAREPAAPTASPTVVPSDKEKTEEPDLGPHTMEPEEQVGHDEGGPTDAPLEDAPGPEGSAHTATDATEGDTGEPPLAAFEGLSKSYGHQRALGPLTLTLESGCIGLLGPNGAGKSTLLRLMMGLLEPTEGTVHVLGEAVRPGGRHLRRRIGYVPEGPARFPGLTGVQAVIHAGRLVGMSKAAAVQRAHQVLDYVGLGEARYRDAETYSTGMRQRLKIAQALVHDPELLILDEPTEGVDPEAREAILALIHELATEHGLRLILSTHLLHDVERVGTHALILHNGHVVEHGPLDVLRTARERGYQVRIGEYPESLMERLTEAGIEHQWVAPDLRVRIDDPRRLLALADEAGLVVRHLAPVELSLNETFERAVAKGEAAGEALWAGEGDPAGHDEAATDAGDSAQKENEEVA